MTALALPLYSPNGSKLVATLIDRQPTLARYGAAVLMLAGLCLALQQVDGRAIDGVNVWVKPAKFFLSTAVFALTAAWFFGYVRPERRRSRLMRGTVAMLVASATFELVWISWQASQGQPSHFNLSSPFTSLMFQLMGLFALLLTATTLPLAWEIGRRPAPGFKPDFVAAVVLGLVLTFLLGTTAGAMMGAKLNHAVGPVSERLPFFGWNRSGGDLRIAHFMGLHAEQAIPLLGAALGATGLSTRRRTGLLLAGTALFTAATVAILVQALAGRPLIPA
jgi:hypothetical protein